VIKVYLDTSVLGHWVLYHFRPEKFDKPLPPTVQASLTLLHQIRNGFFSCKFETSDFALTELSQVIRDDLIATKMMRDAQSLVYFQALKDDYALDKDEIFDAIAYSAGVFLT
jgi:hypothetical protein